MSALAAETGLSDTVARILLARGIDAPEAVRAFVTPQLERDWRDPEGLPGMGACADAVAAADAVLSLSCGVGVQTLAAEFPGKRVLPGVNTMMLGSHSPDRLFVEYCGACGDCVLAETGGICPIVRCSKSMLNGPCGGSVNGKCEVSPDIECGWQLIFDKLNELKLGQTWDEIKPARDWRPSWHGGPRRVQQ